MVPVSGVAADLCLWQDMLYFTSASGTVVAMSNLWAGPVAQSRQRPRLQRSSSLFKDQEPRRLP